MQEARRRPTRRNPREVHAPERAARLRPQTSGLKGRRDSDWCLPPEKSHGIPGIEALIEQEAKAGPGAQLGD